MKKSKVTNAQWAAVTGARSVFDEDREASFEALVTPEVIASVKAWAGRMVRRGSLEPIEDLVQQGMIGFVEAVRRFCHSRKKGSSLQTYAAQWIQELMRTDALPREESLDQPIGGDDGMALAECIADVSQVLPDEELSRKRLYTSLLDSVDELDEREKTIIRLRYWEDQPMEQVGEALGITRQRVHQLEKRALDKLRKKMGGAINAH